MNTEQKAKELVDKFSPHADWNNEYGSSERQANIKHAKQCAIICCEEIMEVSKTYAGKDYEFFKDVIEKIKQL